MKKSIILITSLVLLAVTLFVAHNFFYCPKAVITMPLEMTFAIIKPDAVQAKNSGKIIDIIENQGFDIVGLQKVTLNQNQAEQFYGIHKEKPFFKPLVEFMTSGPAIVMALQKENAVQAWRALMGGTSNPETAPEGTLRKLFGTDITHNATHGSDSAENAALEIKQFFPDLVK